MSDVRNHPQSTPADQPDMSVEMLFGHQRETVMDNAQYRLDSAVDFMEEAVRAQEIRLKAEATRLAMDRTVDQPAPRSTEQPQVPVTSLDDYRQQEMAQQALRDAEIARAEAEQPPDDDYDYGMVA